MYDRILTMSLHWVSNQSAGDSHKKQKHTPLLCPFCSQFIFGSTSKSYILDEKDVQIFNKPEYTRLLKNMMKMMTS